MKRFLVAASVLVASFATALAVYVPYAGETASQEAAMNLPRKLEPSELAVDQPVPISIFKEKPRCELMTSAVDDKRLGPLRIEIRIAPQQTTNDGWLLAYVRVNSKPECDAIKGQQEAPLIATPPKTSTVGS